MHSFQSQEHFSTNNKVDAIAGSEMVENVIFFPTNGPMLVRGAAFVTKLFRILVYEKKNCITQYDVVTVRCVWERNLILHNFVIDKGKEKKKKNEEKFQTSDLNQSLFKKSVCFASQNDFGDTKNSH